MLFASVDVAARIEAAECGLLEACGASVSAQRPDQDVYALPIGSGIASFAGEDSPLNKVAGLGFGEGFDEDALAEAEAYFAKHGAAVQVELSCLGDPNVARRLSARGYLVEGFENVLGRPISPDEPGPSTKGVEVAVSAPAEIDAWLEAVVGGFATPDTEGVPSHEEYPREALRQAIGDMVRAEGFSRYVARRNGEIAGGGSLRTSEGVALLCGAATVPSHRRNGVQAALLAGRLQQAGRQGCDLAVVTTLPGSRSQRNVQRAGFELLYTRAVFRRVVGR